MAPSVTLVARRLVLTLHRPAFQCHRIFSSSPSTRCTCYIVRSFANIASPPPPPPPATHTQPISSRPSSSPSRPPSESESVLDDALSETQRLVDTTSPSSPPPPSSTVIYTSPFFSAVRRVKLFSLTSCVLSLLSSPIYLLLAPPSIPLSGRIALTTAVVSFSLGTTLALTKITHSYITRIHLTPPSSSSPSPPSSPSLTFETLNLFGRPRYQRVSLDQLRPLHNRLITNTRAKGVGQKGQDSDFYLHVDLVDHPLLQPLAQQLIVVEGEGQTESDDKAKTQ